MAGKNGGEPPGFSCIENAARAETSAGVSCKPCRWLKKDYNVHIKEIMSSSLTNEARRVACQVQ
jgi:hypothetical protein